MKTRLLVFSFLLSLMGWANPTVPTDPIVIHTRLSAAYPIEMNSLDPYLITANVSSSVGGAFISSVSFTIDGVEYTASNPVISQYEYWWTPTSFGSHTISISATDSNGNTANHTATVEVANPLGDRTVQTFENALIDWTSLGSQWAFGTFNLPQSVGVYENIIANFSVSCPNITGGCDDWDRLCWVQIQNPAGEWVELIRYITPYGIGCNHSIDVTDFESLLQGTVPFRVFIDTWGTGGWNINLNLEYVQGSPTFKYSSVNEIWQGYYNFGDMSNLQPVPVKTVAIPEHTTAMNFRLITTGHGWGSNNSGNAAEFYHAIHKLKINDQTNASLNQTLWRFCNPNPDNCSGQLGNWQYNRAGWCPGAISTPYQYDLSSYIPLGNFQFSYIFKENYRDYCNASNPNCVSGVNCADCNDGYNPYYRVGGYMIYKGNQPISTLATNAPNKENYSIRVFPNATPDIFQINLDKPWNGIVVTLHTVSGEAIKNYHFKSTEDLNAYRFNVSGLSDGVYFIKVYNSSFSYSDKILIQH
ncbi:MAG: peptide-N-glycosidase F-related protein [Flavobacterium sp.]